VATQTIEIRVLDKTATALTGISKRLQGLNSGLLGINRVAALATGALAGIGGGNIIRNIVQTTSRFQDLRIALNSVTGSAQAGGEALGFIKDFAETSIFEVDTLTKSFIQLKASGIEPTRDLLTTFQDVAAVTTDRVGSLQALTDLFSRTVGGGLGLIELERLATRGVDVFGILEEQLGKTRLEISDFGKTADGARQIRDALVKGLNQRFGGAAAASMNSLSGVFSNFQDAVMNTMDTIGSQGLIQVLTDVTKSVSEFISENQELAVEIGQKLTKAALFAVDAFHLVRANIGFLGKAFIAFFALKIGLAVGAMATAFGATLVRGLVLATRAVKALALAAAANPIIAAGLAIAAGVEYLTGAFSKLAEKMNIGGVADDALDALENGFTSVAETIGLNTEAITEFGNQMDTLDERAEAAGNRYKEQLETHNQTNEVLTEQEREQERINRALERRATSLGKYLDDMNRELEILGMSEDQREYMNELDRRRNELAKALKVSVEELTEAELKQLEIKTQQILAQEKLNKQIADAKAALPSIAEAVGGDVFAGNDIVVQAEQERQKQLEILRDQGIISQEQYNKAVAKLDADLARQRQDAMSQQVKDTLELMKAGKAQEADLEALSGKQKVQLLGSIGKDVLNTLGQSNEKAFRLAKAIAIAEAIVNVARGISAALALPFPFNLGAAALVAAQGYAQINAIKAQKYTGPRARGGNVEESGSYLVGERGPELFVPNQRGTIISSESMRNMGRQSGGDAPVTVNFNISTVDATGVDDLLINRRGTIVGIINQAMNKRGKVGVTG
jgi:hypothetical protein